MTQTQRATDLLTVLGRLTDVLERETGMLRAMKPSELRGLQQEKLALTAAYEAQIKAFKDQPALRDGLPPAARADLRTAVERFQTTLRRNERGLRAAKTVTERVLRAIAEEVDKKRREATGYSGRGADPSARALAGPEPVSIAFNRTV